jgi:hypothetical protein
MNAISKWGKRFDGFMNVLSGLGSGMDRTMATTQTSRLFNRYSFLDLSDLYLTNGLAQKIVDRPSDDAVQRGIEIEGDEDNLMGDEYDRLQVLAKLAIALRWSRLFGGAVGAFDGQLAERSQSAARQRAGTAVHYPVGPERHLQHDGEHARRVGQPE